MKRLLLGLAMVVALALATAVPVFAHVPPDTNVGGQTACIIGDDPATGEHDPLLTAAAAPDNSCGVP